VAALLFLDILLSPFADEMTAAVVAKLGLARGRHRGRAWPRMCVPPLWPSSASRAGGSWSSALHILRRTANLGLEAPASLTLADPAPAAPGRPHPPPRAIDSRLAASRSVPCQAAGLTSRSRIRRRPAPAALRGSWEAAPPQLGLPDPLP
jgi:hypothetical protein